MKDMKEDYYTSNNSKPNNNNHANGQTSSANNTSNDTGINQQVSSNANNSASLHNLLNQINSGSTNQIPSDISLNQNCQNILSLPQQMNNLQTNLLNTHILPDNFINSSHRSNHSQINNNNSNRLLQLQLLRLEQQKLQGQLKLDYAKINKSDPALQQQQFHHLATSSLNTLPSNGNQQQLRAFARYPNEDINSYQNLPWEATTTATQAQGVPGHRSSQLHTRNIPCPARRMSKEHKPNTAYFKISSDKKHGTELICSFPACRNGGVKFIWCEHCKEPIARRNFKKNHLHEDVGPLGSTQHIKHKVADEPPRIPSQVSKVPSTSMIIPKKGTDVKNDANVDRGCDDGNSHSSSSISDKGHNIKNSEKDKPLLSSEGKSKKSDVGKDKLIIDPGVKSPECLQIDDVARQVWISLLHERPDDTDKASLRSWLERVSSVSSEIKSSLNSP